jgi:pimeloyl-ACP methyl ester carboxylesterase
MAWAQWYAQADPCALHETAKSLVEWSDSSKLLDLFKSLRDRAYVYGENEVKDYLIPDLQGVSSYRIPEAGHFVMLDNPDAFYPLVSALVHRDT